VRNTREHGGAPPPSGAAQRPSEVSVVVDPESPRRPQGTRWFIELGAALVVALAYLFGPRSDPSEALVRRAEANSWDLLQLEQRLHLDVESTVQSLVERLGLVVPVNWFYGTLHFVVTAATLVYLYRRRPEHYPRWRTAFVAASVIAFVCYRLWPVAPPRLLVDAAGSPVLTDTLAAHPAPWTFHSGAMSEVANQYAAMPSMHAGWALFCALALGLGRSRRTRVALLGYPLLVTIVIMASGNHYLVDAVGGFAVVGLGLGLVVAVTRMWSGHRTPGRSVVQNEAHGDRSA